MKGFELSMTEKEKFKTVEKIIKGKLKIERAAITSGFTVKRVKKLISIYHKEGASGFSHKSKGKTPHNKANKALGDSIIMLYQNKYLDSISLILKRN